MGKERGWNNFTHLRVTEEIYKQEIIPFFVVKYLPHCTVLSKDHKVVHNYKDFKGGKWEVGKIDRLLAE